MTEAIKDLSAIPQWVAHTASKIPIGPDGSAASSTDPTTWMTFDEARRVQRAGGFAGVGFVFSKDDDLIGVDLDNALESDGTVKPWAEEIVCQLNSYTEVSPSGTGLHVWVRGQLPAGGSRIKVGDGLLEVYEKARYFTVTGRHLTGTPSDITTWGGNISEWYWVYFEHSSGPAAPLLMEVDEDLDAEIAEALGYIESDDYAVWIAVGFAIKSHFGDSGFELWRQWSMKAGNYCGDEKAWRKYRGFGKRSGVTYRTIFHFAMENGFACSTKYLDPEDIFPGINAFCESLLGEPEEPWEPADEEPTPEAEQVTSWAYDAADIRENREDREYVIEPAVAGFSDVIVMAGPPKSMKSFITLDMLSHFACGERWHGIGPHKGKLRSLVLNCELHIDAVAQRMRALGKRPASGTIYITDRIRSGITAAMVEDMKAHVAEHGPFDIVVIDPIANLFTEDNENDNKAMMVFLSHLERLREVTTGDDAILWLVHHSKKTSLQDMEADPFNSFRGASSLRGFYDTGVAVWRKKDDTLGMAFEQRNGAGMERLNLDFDQGLFVTAESATANTGDLDLLASVMIGEEPNTKTHFARRARNQEQNIRGKCRSEKTWMRIIEPLVGHEIEDISGRISWAD